MSLWKLAFTSLRHFWRTNLALLAGIAVGTAVLTGALIVGDSIRGSLRALTIERLGKIDEILIGEQFFRRELVDELQQNVAQAQTNEGSPTDDYSLIQPAILINQATVEKDNSESISRSQGVTVIGCTSKFWELETSGNRTPKIPGEGQIVISQSLADELNTNIGERLLLRVGKPTTLAADSPLARKSDIVKTIVDLELVDIVPSRGLGRFSLQASQQVPANAFVDLATLQEGLDQEGRINAILVAGSDAGEAANDEVFQTLHNALSPRMEDLGLKVKRVSLDYEKDGQQETVFTYDTLTNDRMLFDPEHDTLIAEKLASWNMQPVFTYLATRIQRVDATSKPVGPMVPYSMITGIDSVEELGPLQDANQQLLTIGADQIVLNAWTAANMEATVGEKIRVTWFDPETTHGEVVERSRDFELIAIADMSEPWQPFNRGRPARYDVPPTLVNDPDLTAEVKGITDADSINKWDAPFPMDATLLRSEDDDYWERYRTTPKAFVSLATGKRLWRSRFGTTTGYRIPVAGTTIDQRRSEISRVLSSDFESFGMYWIRAKRDGLAASKGTTPFDALFLGFSQFIIAAALMLVALLLRLGIEQRATQLGVLGAMGFSPARTFRLLLAENVALVVLGSLAGVLLGVLWAWFMLSGLRTWWLEAVVTPFMRLELSPVTLLIGLLLGIIVSLATIAFTLRRLRKMSLSQLMAGKTESPPELRQTTKGKTPRSGESLCHGGSYLQRWGWDPSRLRCHRNLRVAPSSGRVRAF